MLCEESVAEGAPERLGVDRRPHRLDGVRVELLEGPSGSCEAPRESAAHPKAVPPRARQARRRERLSQRAAPAGQSVPRSGPLLPPVGWGGAVTAVTRGFRRRRHGPATDGFGFTVSAGRVCAGPDDWLTRSSDRNLRLTGTFAGARAATADFAGTVARAC